MTIIRFPNCAVEFHGLMVSFFMILSDGKLVGGWYLSQVCGVMVENSIEKFCVVEER